jgi:hypothetical protein
MDTIIERLKREFNRGTFSDFKEFNTWRKTYLNKDYARRIRIGESLHIIIEYYLLKAMRELGQNCFFEVKPNSVVSNHRIDSCIIRDKYFKKNSLFSLLNSFLPREIYLINIDYSTSDKYTNYYYKSLKGYQGQYKYCFIVSLFSTKKKTYDFNKPEIPFNENISAILFANFLNLFGLDKVQYSQNMTYKEYLLTTVNLGKQAVYSQEAYKSLRDQANSIRLKLEKMKKAKHHAFERFLELNSPIAKEKLLKNESFKNALKILKKVQFNLNDFTE